MKSIFITGGAGFIGSALIRYLLDNTNYKIINIDKLTYSGNLESIPSSNNPKYFFERYDICDEKNIKRLFDKYQPDAVMHLAAESHVDRSIDAPNIFLETNIMGTFNLLQLSRMYYENLDISKKKIFRFHHISTDEVFGDLPDKDQFFNEEFSYKPSSPYAASKASSDHFVRAWGRTFKLPILITNCSNNYGPYQFPEKLIPHTILNAVKGKKINVYGNGKQIRDWLFVDDHIKALVTVLELGQIGDTYNIGGNNEKMNIDVVTQICNILDKEIIKKPKDINSFKDQINFVKDRPGHDLRYAIDSSKIKNELNWEPTETFESGIKKTVLWYLENENWWERILSGTYMLKRLGESPE